MRIQRGKPPTAGEVEEARANVFLDKLRATLKSGEFKKQDQLIERLMEEGFTSTDIASACLAQLQSGEAAPAPTQRTGDYERPERPERGHFQDGPRGRPDDRRAPRYESREHFERPQRFAERREERPPRAAAPATKAPRPEKPPAAGAPASDLARIKAASAPAGSAHGVTRPAAEVPAKP